MPETGIRDVRNQGVLLRGTNDSVAELLDLCFALLDDAKIMPYYFYMCDMIPNSEHWRLSLAEAQRLQHGIMGYLPGFATPRFICDVPYVGKQDAPSVNDTGRAAYLRTGRRTTAPAWRAATSSPWSGSMSTTTRSTCCPRRARPGGGRTLTPRSARSASAPTGPSAARGRRSSPQAGRARLRGAARVAPAVALRQGPGDWR